MQHNADGGERLNQMKMVRFWFYKSKHFRLRNLLHFWTLLKLSNSQLSHLEEEMQPKSSKRGLESFLKPERGS